MRSVLKADWLHPWLQTHILGKRLNQGYFCLEFCCYWSSISAALCRAVSRMLPRGQSTIYLQHNTDSAGKWNWLQGFSDINLTSVERGGDRLPAFCVQLKEILQTAIFQSRWALPFPACLPEGLLAWEGGCWVACAEADLKTSGFLHLFQPRFGSREAVKVVITRIQLLSQAHTFYEHLRSAAFSYRVVWCNCLFKQGVLVWGIRPPCECEVHLFGSFGGWGLAERGHKGSEKH